MLAIEVHTGRLISALLVSVGHEPELLSKRLKDENLMHFKSSWISMAPLLAVVAILLLIFAPSLITDVFAAIALGGGVFAGVHHAELIAHRIGEPFGTLVLAVAVTVIEVGLVVSLMISDSGANASLPRDTVFAAIMIACNGVVGLCLVTGAIRYHEQSFQLQGASAALAILSALSTLTLVFPSYTSSVSGPAFSVPQLIFAGFASLVLYMIFVFVQTVRHRNYFLPTPVKPGLLGSVESDAGKMPSISQTWIAFAQMIVCLVSIVALAKLLSPTIEAGVRSVGAPLGAVGVVIATLVILPEGIAALRAARLNKLQISLNLALGSALASIGLTIPAVAIFSILSGHQIWLGLGSKEIVLLALTLVVSVITLGTGSSTILQGVVHLIVFAAFLFLTFVP